MVRATLLMLTIVLGVAPAIARPDNFKYVRLDTRDASREATLGQYMPVLQTGDWHVIGPFDNVGRDKHDVVYPPELDVNLTATHTGRNGREVGWRRVPTAEWDQIDFKIFGSESDNTEAIAYAWREVTSPGDAEVLFEIGSDDGLKLWLNGRLMIDADVYRGLNVEDHVLRLPFREGVNTILVKVTQGGGGWAFQMRPRFDSRILARLNYHLDRDFPTSPEARHYQTLSLVEPEGVVLEVGGVSTMPDGRPIVTTRRGEVWIIENAYDDPPFDCQFKLFAFGLHEPLGAMWEGNGLLVAQRAEVTKLIDTDGDDRADVFRTISDDWGVSGNYHEFAFGPEADGGGDLWVTLNVGFCGALGKSIVPWRGWAVKINDDGTLAPVCGGLRSPAGIGRNAAGDMFYTDNQGDWVGTCKLAHMAPGDWHGHPGGNRWYEGAGMKEPRGEQDFKHPAVWFPYDRMGRSASDIVVDDTGGRFGPFQDQLFVGDQYAASIMRVFLEQVDGVYQGACFPFRSGLDCGVTRMCFAPDGSMIVGMTNRGWWSFGSRPWGVQRIVYSGQMPFEVLSMHARPDGFELSFTQPVDRASASNPASYEMASFTHERWENYGSPEIDRLDLTIHRATVAEDGLSVRLYVDGLRPTYVHELMLPRVRNEAGDPLLHAEAYYTLNVIPQAVARGKMQDPVVASSAE